MATRIYFSQPDQQRLRDALAAATDGRNLVLVGAVRAQLAEACPDLADRLDGMTVARMLRFWLSPSFAKDYRPDAMHGQYRREAR